jgi:hypothetical protein
MFWSAWSTYGSIGAALRCLVSLPVSLEDGAISGAAETGAETSDWTGSAASIKGATFTSEIGVDAAGCSAVRWMRWVGADDGGGVSVDAVITSGSAVRCTTAGTGELGGWDTTLLDAGGVSAAVDWAIVLLVSLVDDGARVSDTFSRVGGSICVNSSARDVCIVGALVGALAPSSGSVFNAGADSSATLSSKVDVCPGTGGAVTGLFADNCGSATGASAAWRWTVVSDVVGGRDGLCIESAEIDSASELCEGVAGAGSAARCTVRLVRVVGVEVDGDGGGDAGWLEIGALDVASWTDNGASLTGGVDADASSTARCMGWVAGAVETGMGVSVSDGADGGISALKTSALLVSS